MKLFINTLATAGIRFYYSMMPGECLLKRNIGSNSMSDENNVITKIRSVLQKLENISIELEHKYFIVN